MTTHYELLDLDAYLAEHDPFQRAVPCWDERLTIADRMAIHRSMISHSWIHFSDGTSKCRKCGLMTICPEVEDQRGCN